MYLPIVSRQEWGALPPKNWFTRPPGLLYVLHAISGKGGCHNFEDCKFQVRQIQRYHMVVTRDIRYNFLIGGDLRVYEGRGWECQPGVSSDYIKISNKSLYIGYIGSFGEETVSGPRVPEAMVSVANELALYGVEQNFIRPGFTQKDLF